MSITTKVGALVPKIVYIVCLSSLMRKITGKCEHHWRAGETLSILFQISCKVELVGKVTTLQFLNLFYFHPLNLFD